MGYYYDMLLGDWNDDEFEKMKISKNRDSLINELLGIKEEPEPVEEPIVDKGFLNKMKSYFKL